MYRFLMTALIAALSIAELPSQSILKPFNLDKINTDKNEDEPHSTVNANGIGELYYTCNGELYSAKRDKKGWQAGKPNKELEERGDVRSLFVFFSKPGALFPQTIFYATNSDGEKRDGRGDNFDLYSLTRNSPSGPDFTVPGPLLAVCTPADEMHPWLTPDGKLYFSRKIKEGWRISCRSAASRTSRSRSRCRSICRLAFTTPR